MTGTQTKGTASAQPEVLVTDGKFNGSTAEVGTAGVVGHLQLKGGYYVHNTNLSKYIPEGYEEVPLASDRPEYTEGYRYEVAEEGFHGIDVCKIGSTKYKSLEEALQVVKSGETIIMIANYIMATPGDYILPSGAKLLVPYSGQTATKETNLEYVEGTSAATLNLKLTFGEGVHLVSQGVIECGAKQTGQGSSELTGQVYGSYGHIYLREGSSITVESGASLYAWGYVTGKGEIILKNGGKSYEMFQFGWYKGGNTTSDINSNKSSYKIFPMTDYSYQNIECPITYYPGSSAYGRVAVKPSSYSSMQTPSAMLVGTADNSMFKMTTAEASANTWVKKVYDPETDITNWIMNSGASISGISMNVGVKVNSADFYLPITSNFRITLNYGEMNINNDVIFLPGSQLIINKEATGILKSGKLLFFYDAEDWFTGLGHVSVQASGWSKAKTCGYYYYPATYSPTWGTTNPRKSVYARDKASLDKGVTPLPDAELFVHGKMIVNGSLYTSGDGNASSIGRNANIHSTNEDAGKIQFNTKVTGSKALYKVCFAIGASEANNSWSDMIYGGQTTAYPAHLTNGDGTYVQSSGTEAGKQYVYVDNQWQCWEENGCYTYDAQNHPYAKPAAYVQLTSDQPDANHLLHDAATGTRNFVWDADCYWWEVVTTPTAEGYYQSINPDYNGKYNYYYYDGSAACWKIKKITVKWNINGSTTDYSVGYGTKPEWLGATPSKSSSSSNYVWRWDGWTKGSDATVLANDDLPYVTENTTFTAHFCEKYYEYNVTFKNSDGTILESKNWIAGTTPSYEGTPTKNPTVDYTYEFNGTWSPAITTVSGSATYTAQYTATPRAYTITFLNYDMSVLGTTEVVYNGTPNDDTYKAAIAPSDFEPYKPDNNAYSFEFAGWRLQGASENGFAQVKGNQTYVAQFNETTKKYRISFVDEDGETILHWTQLEYDAMPSYDGPTTSSFNKQDAEWKYAFTGWTPAEFTAVKGPQTYTATYSKEHREYTITWLNDDNSLIDKTKVVYGEVPTHADATKTSTAEWNYTFTGWDKTLVAVTEDTTYKATFSAEKRKYTITWKNGDATIEIDSNVPYGTTPSFDSATPAKAATAQYTYTFSGWSPSVSSVTGDATYTALFSSTVNKYTITFKNGKDVLQSTEWEYGETPEYTGTTPVSPKDNDKYVHPFNGWSPAVTSVTGEDIYMAVFGPAKAKMYDVVWKDWNGDTLYQATKGWGWDIPKYEGATPSRAKNGNKVYTFSGWSEPVSVVENGDATYTARYALSIDVQASEEVTEISIAEDEEVKITTVEVKGKLNVAADKTLTTDDLILEGTPTSSGEIIGNVDVTQNAYFDFSQPDGFKAKTWYAVAVPWQVAVPAYEKAHNGVYLTSDGENYIQQELGRSFDLIYYDGALRAEQGHSDACWKYVEDDAADEWIMYPGRAYMIYLTANAKTIRFERKEGADLHTNTLAVETYDLGTGNNKDANWNGIANPATYHAYINANAKDYTSETMNVGQVYNAETRTYSVVNMDADSLVVGQPIFVQATVDNSAVTAYAAHNDAFHAAPRRARAQANPLTRYELYLAPSLDVATDQIIVRMSEEKEEDEYTIGQDLTKMGVSDIVPQMWINRYDSKMCINTVAPVNNTADYPLGISVPQNGEYDIFLNDEPDSESSLYLTYDGEAIWNLSYSPYIASLNKGTDTHYGLRIVKKTRPIVTGIEDATIQNGDAIRKVLVNDQVYIIRNGEVYTVDGQMVK